MSEGRSQTNWAHTSSIIAMIHNGHCEKKSDMKDADSFNPHKAKATSEVIYVDNPEALESMRKAFTGEA